MSNKGLKKFLCGVAIGTGLGILFAPKSGKDTRDELKKSLDKFIDSLKDIDKDDIKEIVLCKVNSIKKSLKDIDKETVLDNVKKLLMM